MVSRIWSPVSAESWSGTTRSRHSARYAASEDALDPRRVRPELTRQHVAARRGPRDAGRSSARGTDAAPRFSARGERRQRRPRAPSRTARPARPARASPRRAAAATGAAPSARELCDDALGVGAHHHQPREARDRSAATAVVHLLRVGAGEVLRRRDRLEVPRERLLDEPGEAARRSSR